MTNKSTPKKTTTKKIPDNVDPKTGEILDAPVTQPAEGEIVQPEEQQQPIPNDKAVALAGPENGTVIIGGVSTAQLKEALAIQTEQRQVIKDFVKTHLEDGVDFGRIHVMSRDKCPDQFNCKKDYHYSKPVLFKPGQEKLFSLFQITGKLERDTETYEMLDDTKNLVAYKCVMYRGDQIVGEGRGSATVGDNRRDVNATIKIAEKRARMDACLSLGFSEYFAQDLDDPDYKSAAENAAKQAEARASAIDKDEFGLFPRDPNAPIDSKERPVLFNMILESGVDKYYVIDALKLNGIEKPESMTSGQARGLMGLIKEGAFKVPEQQIIPEEPETVPDSQLPEDLYPEPPATREAELVIDDDLKENVQTLYNSIGLNASGWMWFIKHVAGKPFGKWEKLTDEEWRRAYQFVTDILEQRVEIDPRYMSNDRPVEQAELGSVANVFPGAKVLKEEES